MSQPEITAEAARLLQAGRPFALATLVDAHGSTPQRVGARLLIRDDGTTLGTLGGGCIEADVLQAAAGLIASSEARLLRFELTEDIAIDYGLACGGNERILVDATLRGPADATLVRTLARAEAGETRAVLLTTLDAEPRRLVVCADGAVEGRLGPPHGEAIALARALLAEPQPRPGAHVLTDGTSLYAEVYEAPPEVLIVGAGHVGKAVATLASFLGWRYAVIDDRAGFANRGRFPDAREVIAADVEQALRDYAITPSTAVVIVTRGHKYDYQALSAAARSRAGYVGLMGSRRKVALIYRQLLEDGVPAARLRDVRAPIGLDIGAVSPEEIAVAIMAELTMHRLGGSGAPLTAGDPLIDAARRRARV